MQQERCTVNILEHRTYKRKTRAEAPQVLGLNGVSILCSGAVQTMRWRKLSSGDAWHGEECLSKNFSGRKTMTVFKST